MKQFILRIIPFLPILFVVILSIVVVINSHQSETILSGWDTLHPEFNIKLYFDRAFWGAWQEHQGLGAVAAQAHLAELSKIPVVWLLKSIVGMSLVRYVFISSLYILGGISTYWYLRYVWFKQKKGIIPEISASLGALLYLFNLGTLQQFHVPLEMFAVHFATLGFTLGSLHLFITTGKKKTMLFFLLLQIFSAPAAHTATLFYVYSGLLLGYGFILSILQKNHIISNLKRLFITFILVLVANAYWMGPNLYYVFNNGQEIKEAKINRNFSDEAFWQNQAFGGVKDVAISKNFLFNWKIYNYQTQEFDDMFADWDTHLKKIQSTWSSILIIIFSLGIVLSFYSNKRQKVPLFLLFLFSFIFLNNLNQPFQGLYSLVISTSDTLKEALRFPFTKFSILFIFATSVYFAEFCEFLFQTITKIKIMKIKNFATITVVILLTFTVLYPTKPLLTGGLISDKIQIKIPQEYFELFDWFNTKPESQRIALFPIIDFWPWSYYDWSNQNGSNGYQGGGFLWFGLKQPLLNREFDRWMPQNEYFLHEMFAAVEANDHELFSKILEKYSVEWLIYDENMFNPQERQGDNILNENNSQKLFFDELLNQHRNIKLEKSFEKIHVYSVHLQNKSSENSKIEKISSNQKNVTKDIVFNSVGNYITDSSFNNNYIFSNLHNERVSQLVTKTDTGWSIKNQTKDFDSLVLPNWKYTQSFLPVNITAQMDENGNNITVTIQAILPEITTFTDTYSLQEFAQNQIISVPVELLFIDDYYFIKVDKQSNILDPSNNEKQDIGTSFVQYDQDLKIIISANLDNRQQSIVIPKTLLQQLFPIEKELALNTNDEISIIYNDSDISKISSNYSPHNSFFEENCAEKGTVSFTDAMNSRVFYAVDGGIACQGFLLNNLPPGDGYLLHMNIQNNMGPRVYVQANEMGKTKIFFQETPKQLEEKITYGIFPQNNNDLSFVIVNRSFGSFAAQNTLNDLELLPIPFEYFSKIIAKKTTVEADTNITAIIRILNPKRADWYSVILNKDHDTGIVVLNQSFDDGWIAISLDEPFKKIPHYKYNSWANAWEVTKDDTHMFIFFWPQLLVWTGFVILGITIFLLVRKKQNNKPTKRFDWRKVRKIFHAK